MTFYDAQNAVFKITDTGTTLRDISDYIVSITPRFGRRENDALTLGDTHEQPSPGIDETTFDIELLYSEDALVGTDTVLGPLLADTTARAWEFYPRGVSGTKYYGNGFVMAYQPGVRVGGLVNATATVRATSRTRT
jgi:hypothetical protein